MNEIEPGLRKLMDAHPLLFHGRAPPAWSYLMPGWYAIVDKLCTDIEAALGPERSEKIAVRQIKEKFGALRFYYRLGEREDIHADATSPSGRQHMVMRSRGSTEPGAEEEDPVVSQLRAMTKAACEASTKICETCGAPGEVRNVRGWYTALCDVHLAEKMAVPQAGQGS